MWRGLSWAASSTRDDCEPVAGYILPCLCISSSDDTCYVLFMELSSQYLLLLQMIHPRPTSSSLLLPTVHRCLLSNDSIDD